MATAQSSSDQREEDELSSFGMDRTLSCVQSPAHISSSHLIVRQTIPDDDAHSQGGELAVQRGAELGQYVQANITAPVNFGDQEIHNNTSIYKQRVGDVTRQEVHHVERQDIAHVERQEIHVTYVTHSSADHPDNANENECWSLFNAEELPRIQEVNPEDVSRAVELLDQNRRVALCGPPGSGKSSLGHAILTHYHHRGFKACLISKICCQCQQSFCKKKQTIILIDGGFGVVRSNSDQYDRCQDLINNTQCLLVLTVYPHLLRDMAVLEAGCSRPLMPPSLLIDMRPRLPDPNDVCTPFATNYQPLFQRMLHDNTFGHLMAALLALSMLGSYSLESYPPDLTSDLQRLGLHSVDHYHLKQLAYNFRGSILPETGPGFASRLVYDAAGLALGSLHSTSVLLQVCDVTFLVQHVRTSGESHNSVILLDRDRSVLMQRMYEMIVDGEMAALCQHPSLSCLEFLKDFEDFLTSHKNYVHRVVCAVDREQGLPLLYWSVWSPSSHLTSWCLTITLQQVRDSQVLPLQLVSVAVVVWLTETDIDTRLKAKQLMMKFKPLAKKVTVFKLPFPSILLNQDIKLKVSGVKTSLKTYKRRYLDDPSLPILATLLSVTVTEDAVTVELPSQHLALRLLADREVDETDRDGNTLLHIAADKGNLEAITLAVKSGASLTKTNNKGLTPYQLAQGRKKKSNKVTYRGNVVFDLFTAIRDGNIVRVKTLLCYGSSVDDKDDRRRTGLLVACKAGQENIADLLIDLGADVNVTVTLRWEGPQTPLFFACHTGLIQTVELLLKHNAVIDARNKWKQTALHCACQCESPTASADIIRLLLDAGADVNARDRWGRTPLHYAACSDNTETLRRLIHHEADLNAKDNEGRTPLHCAYTASKPGIMTQLVEAGAETGRVHQAVVRGDVDALVTLLQQGADVNQHDTSMGCSPLHAACLMGRTDIVTCLTRHGAKVNAVDDRTRTPLHIACQTGVADIATCLTQRGAHINAVDERKRTPLHIACAAGQTHVVRQLIDEGAAVNARDKVQFTPLHEAADKGNIETVVCLLEHGAEHDATADYGTTPLHTACVNGHTETAQCLLQHGANVNAVSKWNETPLHTACENGHTETAQCLLQHGADVNAVSKWNGRPLHIACENGHTETAQCLLQHGANVNAVSKWNETPLHTACENGHTETAQCLLQHGADVNAVTKLNGTPLYIACENGHTETAQFLLQRGVNVNAVSKWNGTPLHIACENGHTETAQCLLQHEANVNAVSERGETTLHTACENGHTRTAQCLLQHGANVNAVSERGETTLHTACWNGHTQTAQCLLQHGANVNVVSERDGTPLDVTRNFARHCDDLVTLLVQHGAVSRDQVTVTT